jgi:hypothetical protein
VAQRQLPRPPATSVVGWRLYETDESRTITPVRMDPPDASAGLLVHRAATGETARFLGGASFQKPPLGLVSLLREDSLRSRPGPFNRSQPRLRLSSRGRSGACDPVSQVVHRSYAAPPQKIEVQFVTTEPLKAVRSGRRSPQCRVATVGVTQASLAGSAARREEAVP